MPPGKASVEPVIVTKDATLKLGEGFIHWITISNTHVSAATAVELADGVEDKWGVSVGGVNKSALPFHALFSPPIFCATSIVIDITGGTVKATVGLS